MPLTFLQLSPFLIGWLPNNVPNKLQANEHAALLSKCPVKPTEKWSTLDVLLGNMPS